MKCRLCKTENTVTIIDFGDVPLTGIFPSAGEHAKSAPLNLVRCIECGLVQLEDSCDPALMYGMDYGYRSGLNKAMIAHLRDLIGSVTGDPYQIHNPVTLFPGDVVVDIGSNDGTLLGFIQPLCHRIGIDPTAKKFRRFYQPGIDVVEDFFSAQRIREVTSKKAKLITSIAMFYDLEDPVAFAKDVASILDDNGIWIMEMSYLPAMLRVNAFDTICHEHLEYYALRQIVRIADMADLRVIHAYETDTNGGSIVCHLSHRVGVRKSSSNVDTLLDRERTMLIDSDEPYAAFVIRSQNAMNSLGEMLHALTEAGKKVYGLGASTKGNVVLHALGPEAELISAIGDVNPDKHGCHTPVAEIPIINQEDALAANADYYLVLPWHFRDNFLSNPKLSGRKLIFPLPQLEIVEVP